MPTSLTRSLIVLAAVGSGVLSAQPSPTSQDSDDIKATMNAMWAAIEHGDSAGYAKYVHPNFTQFGENDAYLASGRDFEVRSMAAYMRRAKDVHTDMHQETVNIRGGVAWVTYYWTDSGTSDGKRFSSRGKSTRIFVKENGRWLCIHGHYTAVP